ncbi:MAG: glycosyltransferase family 4 protein [Chloroflexota bacterium]|nr:glycosyltransferase family 4 protein [Chloroflexota bacterium]
MTQFNGKVGLVQRVLPSYRAPFFNALGRACTGGLSVFAGDPRPEELIHPAKGLDDAEFAQGRNLHLLRGRFYLCWQRGLMDWLRGWDPDALIVEANPRYLRTGAAVRWMQHKERPVIGWGLGAPTPTGPLAAIRIARRRRFLRQFGALITYSATGAEEYTALGIPRDRIFVAVNAVTPAPEGPPPARPAPEEITQPQLLFVGRLQPRKNLDNLLRACAGLPAERQPALTIVGDGPDRARLEALAADIYPETHFTGALYDEALTAQFAKADLFVLPGTGGLAIQQAMRFGLPVIAAEADGTQADLVRPTNGWQAPPDDIPALTRVLDTALSDLGRLRRMGAESYQIVAEEINLEQMVAVFVEALQRSAA